MRRRGGAPPRGAPAPLDATEAGMGKLDSCGFAVPRYDFVEERDTLIRWVDSKGSVALAAYRASRNAESIDGLPGLPIMRGGV